MPRYIQMCRNKGITIQEPLDMGTCQATEEKMAERFNQAAEQGAEFIMFIHVVLFIDINLEIF